MRLAIAGLLVAAGLAEARTERQLSYPFEQVFPAAVRFLRVDQHLKILEKDPDNGYVLFEISDGKRTYQGAEELVKTTDPDGRAGVRCVVTIKERPDYVELDLLDKFEEKLQAELGPPAPPPAPKEAPPPPAPPKGDPPKDDEPKDAELP